MFVAYYYKLMYIVVFGEPPNVQSMIKFFHCIPFLIFQIYPDLGDNIFQTY